MNWILLVIAGLFEVAFATCLGKAKEASGIIATYWYIGFLVSLIISMILLVKASQHLPIGTAYAVWTGIGAVGTVVLGIVLFKEPATFWRIFFLTSLIASIVGLKLVSQWIKNKDKRTKTKDKRLKTKDKRRKTKDKR